MSAARCPPSSPVQPSWVPAARPSSSTARTPSMPAVWRVSCAAQFHTRRRRRMGLHSSRRFAAVALLAASLAVGVAACGSGDDSSSSSSSSSGSSNKKFTLGVSNTLVGNGWREEMICAVKAQALASGAVSKVLVSNQNGAAPEQIAAIRNLISTGANAIIINPADATALNSVIAEAKRRGVQIVSVDQAIDSPDVYNVTN